MKIYRKVCDYAHKYKAMREPTCGCLACATKWSRQDPKNLPAPKSLTPFQLKPVELEE